MRGRNLTRRVERLAQRRRTAGRSTSKVASFWDFAAAAMQGRHDETNLLWERLPEEDRAYVVATIGADFDPVAELEARINAPLLGLPCGLRELPSDGSGEKG
jgi:hypothetical protein